VGLKAWTLRAVKALVRAFCGSSQTPGNPGHALWTRDRESRSLPFGGMTWETVALPILRWVSEHEGGATVTVGELAESLDVSPNAVLNELTRLIADDYLDGQLRTYLGVGPEGFRLYPYHLRAAGARAVGMWPSGDAGDVLLQVLQAAEASEVDPDRKSRLAKAVEAVGGLARDFVIELGVSVAKGVAGVP